jgi:Family of unknown function (DUF6056)
VDGFGGRWSAVAFAALLSVLFGALALTALWEPTVFDSWIHWGTSRRQTLDLAQVWDTARRDYLGGNPRLGYQFTKLMYSGDTVHAIAEPLVEVAFLFVLAALVVGRWPSPRRADDVAVLALVAAMILVAAPTPVAAAMFGYRPWTGNYVFGFLLHLVLFVPYRFHAVAPRPRHPLFAPVLLVWGALAGLGNEHTGPASIALLALAIIVFRRRGERLAAWMISGLLGLVIGFAALLLAPGNARRYGGMMERTTLVDVVLDRGLLANLRLVGIFLLCAAALLPWLIAARRLPGQPVRGGDRWTLAVLVAAGGAVMLTSLVSPQQGWRLLFAPMALWVAAAALWIRLRVSRRALLGFGAVSAGVLAFQLGAMLHVHGRARAPSEAREARVAGAARGSIVVVPALGFGRSPWFVGDDLRKAKWRRKLADRYHFEAVELEP